MVISFRFGEMSVLHPMLSAGFIGSLFLGAVFLDEEVHFKKIIGVVRILRGRCIVNYRSAKGGEKK